MHTITTKAVESIGEQAKDDWILAPDQHAKALPATAELLKKRLQSNTVTIQTKRYQRYDQSAITAQKQYQQQSTRRIFSAALAAILGGLFLYLQGHDGFNQLLGETQSLFYFILLMTNISFAATTAFYSFQLKNSNSYDDWKEQRAEAENARIEYFQLVTDSPKPPYEDVEDSAEFMALQLEYFRRYMLDMQYHYYQGRSKQHRKKTQRLVFYGGLFTAIFAAGSALGNLGQAELTNPLSNLLALISVIIPSLLTLQAQFTSLHEDRHSLRSYEHTYAELERALMALGRVRYDVAEGKREALTAFVKTINTALATEHQVWLKREEPKL